MLLSKNAQEVAQSIIILSVVYMYNSEAFLEDTRVAPLSVDIR